VDFGVQGRYMTMKWANKNYERVSSDFLSVMKTAAVLINSCCEPYLYNGVFHHFFVLHYENEVEVTFMRSTKVRLFLKKLTDNKLYSVGSHED
jgi:hypothetical protein